MSYDAPSVSAAGVSNVASSGAVSVTVVGRDGAGVSGRSAGARLGVTACEGSGWVSDSGVVCKACGGGMGGVAVGVSAGVQRGSVSGLVSYDAPSVSSAGACNVASSGGMSVTVVARAGGAARCVLELRRALAALGGVTAGLCAGVHLERRVVCGLLCRLGSSTAVRALP